MAGRTALHARLAAAVFLLLTLCVCPVVHGEEGSSFSVERIVLRGLEVVVTDSAVVVRGEETLEMEQGLALKPGDRVRLFFKFVSVTLADSAGTRVVLECGGCSEDAPLELVVGDAASGAPFRQEGGAVHYKVAPGQGWFEILFDLLQGPEEKLVPVGVKGTHFLLEADQPGSLLVTVAEGQVQVSRASAVAEVAAGRSLSVSAAGMEELPADADRLMRMKEIMRGLTPGLPGGPSLPVEGGGSSWVPWALVGAGAAAMAGGGVLHVMAWNANADYRDEARSMCGGDAALPAGTSSASEYYDGKFDDEVAPLRDVSVALYAGGAALAAGGVLWMLLESAGGVAEQEPGMLVVPALGPSGLELWLGFSL